MGGMEEASGSGSSNWSREEEKAFENAVATHGDNWEEIAALVATKSVEQIKAHYDLLLEDINAIEAGRVHLPLYSTSTSSGPDCAGDHADGTSSSSKKDSSAHAAKASRSDQERRKGIAWTEDEHRLFLLGLDKYGKGDWRSISRNFVISRTPTQVASHAQKYFIRLNSMNKERRRSSIHDITSVTSSSADLSSPITGQSAAAAATNTASAKSSSKPPPQTPISVPVPVPMYGTTIGQPVGPLGPAVGTPVTVPPHMAYGVRAPVAGAVVPGAPVAPVAPPMTYPMAPTSSHR